jgi:hypothetical protein
MASRGTAQQQAGLQRAAMQQGADTQMQYAAQLAELRSREQERARQLGGYMREQAASQEAARQRQALSGAATGALGSLAKIFTGTEGAVDAAATEAARVEESKKLLGTDFPGAAKLTGSDIASALGMTGGTSVASPAAAGTGAVAGATLANAAAPQNEIEADLAAQDRSLASIDPSVRAYLGPSEADVQQSGLALGGYQEPVSGRNRLVTGDGIARGTRMVPMTESEKAMKLQADQENLTRLQAGRSTLGQSFSNVPSAVPRISSGGGRDFETQGLQSTLDIRPQGREPSQAQSTPLTTAGFPTSPAAEQVELLRQQRPGRMPRRASMKKTPGGGGYGL